MSMDCGPRFERLAVYIVVFFASASLPVSAGATGEPEQERVSTVGSVPSGLMVVIRGFGTDWTAPPSFSHSGPKRDRKGTDGKYPNGRAPIGRPSNGTSLDAQVRHGSLWL
jgi:hypothetical protein